MEQLIESISKKMDEIGRPYRLVVVNDGSTDGTKELVESYAKRFPITLLNHDANKNVGQVFRTGFQYVLSQAGPDDIIVTKEADNTGDLDILPTMLKNIENGYDFVLASCYAKGGKIIGTTADRRLLSFVANTMLKVCFPMRGINTYSSFYRAYRAESLKKAFEAYGGRLIEEDGFVCMVEMLVKLRRLPVKIVEVPMVLRCNLRKGASKMKKRQTMAAYLRLIFKETGNKPKDLIWHG
jgi:dolichol-phosphate mannosyltransferase